MTTVGNVNKEVLINQNKPAPQAQEIKNGNVSLFTNSESSSQPQTTMQKTLKAQDLNYEGFPKANRLDASEFAGRSLNEVKDIAREFNADFPEQPYVIDYSKFPNPENFSKKNYGGKEEAYTAWKNVVTEWVEDCKQDMATQRSNHIGSMTEKFERAMNNGFFNMYLQMGITRDFIQATYEALQGDINKVKEQLDLKAQQIMQNSRNVGQQVSQTVRTEGHLTREIVILDGMATRKTVQIEAENTRRTVETEAENTRGTVETEAQKTRAEIKHLQKRILNKLSEMPTKKSLVIDFIKGTLHLPIDVAKKGFDIGSYLLGLGADKLKQIAEYLDSI